MSAKPSICKPTWRFSILLLFVLGLLLVNGIAAHAATQLSIVDTLTGQNSRQVNPGETFTLDIRVDTGGAGINGYSVYLTFDENVLEVKNLPSPFIQKSFLGGMVVENDTHGDPGNGISGFQLDYTEGLIGSSKSGSGVIAQLQFKALAAGTVQLGFDNASGRQTAISFPDGNTLPPDSSLSMNITVGQGGDTKSFVVVSGDQQVGTVDQTLAQPFIVKATQNGQPLTGAQVTYQVISGSGKFQGTTAFVTTTGANGQAQATLTLGPQVGAQQVRVTLAGYSGPSLTFTATAQQAAAQRALTILGGDQQSGHVNTSLASPLVVGVTENGQPLAGISVIFEVISGNAKLHTGTQAATQTTNASGHAQASVTLGSAPGQSTIRASLVEGGATPVEFSITALSTITNANLWLRNANTGNTQFTATVGDVVTMEVMATPNGDQITGTKLYLSFDPTFLEVIDQQPGNSGVQPFLPGSLLTGQVSQNASQSGKLDYVETGGSGSSSEGVLASFQLKAKAAIQQTLIDFDLDTDAGRVTTIVHTNGSGQPQTQSASLEVRAPGNRLIRVAGNGQSGQVGEPLPSPLVVAVEDAQGNALADTPVTFTVQQSDAVFEGDSTSIQAITDAEGQAQVVLVLGTVVGTDNTVVEVTGPGMSPITFSATTLAGDAHQLVLASGNHQMGQAGSLLPQPLIASVFDAYGNPVPDQPVFFQVASSDGRLSKSNDPSASKQSTLSIKTDTGGKAAVYWTLPSTVGTKQLTTSAEGLQGSPLTFSATATAGTGVKIEIVSGNQQMGTVGVPMPQPLVVRVLDVLGNVASQTLVTFSVVEGNGQVNGANTADLLTDTAGQARVTLTLGTQAGQGNQQVKAGLSNGESVTFVGSAQAGVASKLLKISGDQQIVKVQQQFGEPLVVQATDNYDNVVPGVTVRFVKTAGAGTLVPTKGTVNSNGTEVTETTNDSGIASVKARAGTQAGVGVYQVEAMLIPDAGANSHAYFTLTVNPGSADSVVEVSGNGQSGNLNTALASPFVVMVRDVYGNPVPSVSVQFVLTHGDGALSSNSSITNESGQASTTLTLGTVAGTNTYTVEARVSGVQGSPIVFNASAFPGGTLMLVKQSGDNQQGVVGKRLSDPLVAKVEDTFHNPIAGITVSFQVISGGGTLDRNSITTGSDGKAEVHWTLGTDLQNQQAVSVYASGVTSSLQFAAQPVADTPTQLTKVQGDYQTGIIENALPEPFVVQVSDRYANLVKGAEIVFSVISGDGELPGGRSQLTVVSDVNGRASTTLTLGSTVGTNLYKVQASLSGSGNAAVEFSASATAGAATAMQIIRGNGQTGVVGQALPVPLQVKVVDQYQNPVSGASVRFEVRAGDGRFANNSTSITTQTDNEGSAGITFILGTQPGSQNQQVKASLVNDSRVSVLFAASATHGPATNLLVVDGNNQVGEPNQVLARPLRVRLTDTFQNPISQAGIFFQVLSGGGTVKTEDDFHASETALTNADGIAVASVKVGTQAGQNVQQVQASLATNSSLNVLFQASVQVGQATSLAKLSGDAQTGPVSTFLSDALRVSVKDAWGNNIPGANVVFRVIEGNGKLSSAPAIGSQQELNIQADTLGLAQVYYTLGTQVGVDVNQVEALLPNSASSAVTFTARATADPGSVTIHKLTTGELSGKVDTALYPPLAVKLLDQYGNPATDMPVTFEIASGDSHFLNSSGVSVQMLEIPTDAAGEGEVTLILGTQVGTNNHTVLARISSAPSRQVSFLVSTTAGSIAALEKISGDDQTATAGQAVADPLVVRARDEYGNIAVGVELMFHAKNGGVAPVNEFPPAPRSQLLVPTDSNGIAEVRYIVGSQAGTRNYSVEVYATGQQQPMVSFVASAIAGQPVSLTLVSGDQQTGTVGNALPEPLSVAVADAYANPVEGASVQFDVLQGTGLFASSNANTVLVHTNVDGIASVQFVLGAEAGDGNNMAQAMLPGMAIEPVLFIASAVPDQGRKFLKVSGDHQVGIVGTPLPAPFVVAVRDRLGNATSGVTVLFEVREGAGILENGKSLYTAITDSQGNAQVRLTLGSAAGNENQAVQASLPDQQSEKVTFRASAQPASSDELVLVSGDSQSGVVGLPLAEPLVVRVVDRYGNPVVGVEVVYSILAGNSSFQGAQTLTATTNEQGLASAVLTLDARADVLQIVQAQAPVVGSEVLFQATGKPATPARLLAVSGDKQQGEAGQPLPQPFILQVTDIHSNPIPDVPVQFQVLVGNGGFASTSSTAIVPSITIVTNALGQASVHYVLGTDVEVVNQIEAALTGDALPHLSILLSAEPRPATGASLVILSGDNQVGTVQQSLPAPMTVLVRDAHNNVAPGATVQFQVVSGEGQLVVWRESGEEIATSISLQADALGQARVQLVLGPKAGTHNNIVLVSPVDFNSPSVYFRSSASPGLAQQLVLISGDQQEGVVATTLDHTLVVQVKDEYGNTVPGIGVDFLVTAGDGGIYPKDLTPTQATTLVTVDSDEQGRASVFWQLGPQAEAANQVKASVPGILAGPVVFSALAHAGGDVQITKVGGDRQTGVVGQTLPRPIQVQVTDQGGNRIANTELSFVVVDGSGRLEDGRRRYNTFTNTQGIASANWVLGNLRGEENNSVQVSSLDHVTQPVLFKASAVSDQPYRLILLSGDEQRAVADTVLLEPLQVLALDRYNNPVDDVVITLEVEQESGQLLFELPGTTTTIGVDLLDLYSDIDGHAQALYQLGSLGEPYTERIRVTSPSLPGTELFFNEYKNAPPVFVEVSPKQVKENEFLQFEVFAQDPDGDTLSYRVTHLPTGANFDTANSQLQQPRLFRWRPGYADAGVYPVSFIATDSLGNSVTQVVTITVLNQNRVPTLMLEENYTLDEGVAFTLELNANDPDNEPLLYGLDPMPAGAKLDPQSGLFVWLPGFQQAGSYPILVSVSDPQGASATQQITLTVRDVSKPPILAAIPAMSVNEGQIVEIQLSAEDPDGSTVRFEVVNAPQGAGFDGTTGIFRWTPGFDQAGEYSIRFVAIDSTGQQATQTASVVVHDQSQPPLFTAVPNRGLVLGDEAQLTEFEVVAMDPEGSTVTLTASALPSGSVFDSEIQVDGTHGFFAWRPQYDQAGNYEIKIVAQDTLGTVATRTITVSILNVNRPPTILSTGGTPPPLRMVVTEGELVEFEIEATDPDGEDLTYEAQPLPADASIEQQRFHWQPGYQQAGVYKFNVMVRDPFGATDTADAEITVLDQNHEPVWEVVKPVTIFEGKLLELLLQAADPDGDPLVYTATDLPTGAHLTPIMVEDGVSALLQWTPGYDQSGQHHVLLTATDTRGISADQQITITVENVNQAPVIPQSLSVLRNEHPVALALGNDGTTTLSLDKGDTIEFTLSASDADADVIEWQTEGLPLGASWGQADADGTMRFQWTPDLTQIGSFNLTFTATDTHQAAAKLALQIQVRDVDLPPVWDVMSPYVVRPTKALRIPLRAADPEGMSVSYRAEWLPSGAHIEGSSLVWTPGTNQVGSYRIPLIARSSSLESTYELLIVVNRQPWDVNGDDRVDIFDLVQLGQSMGVGANGHSPLQSEAAASDINQDGIVDVLDFVIIGQHFGEKLSQMSPAAPGLSMGVGANDHSPLHAWLESSPEGAELWAQIPESVVGFEVAFWTEEPSAAQNVKAASRQWLWVPPRLDAQGQLVVAAVVPGGVTPISPLGRRCLLVFTHQPLSAIRVDRITFVQADGTGVKCSAEHGMRNAEKDSVEPSLSPHSALETPHSLLLTNYPNPFNPETWIPFDLAQPAPVSLRIYDAQGRLVRTLELGWLDAGYYRTPERAAYWDGRNTQGERVSSGVYLYQIQAGEFQAIRKMVVRK